MRNFAVIRSYVLAALITLVTFMAIFAVREMNNAGPELDVIVFKVGK